jgi:hypothetical protein
MLKEYNDTGLLGLFILSHFDLNAYENTRYIYLKVHPLSFFVHCYFIKSQSQSDVYDHLSQTQKKRASGRLSPNSWVKAFMCWGFRIEIHACSKEYEHLER